VLALRRVRRHVWVNSAKVVDWLQALRAPVIAGLCSYGLAAFLTRFADELLARPGLGNLFGRAPGVAYRGYSIVLPIVGLFGALAFYAHRRWWRTRPVRRWLFGPVLTLMTLAASVGLLQRALQERAVLEEEARAQRAALELANSAAALSTSGASTPNVDPEAGGAPAALAAPSPTLDPGTPAAVEPAPAAASPTAPPAEPETQQAPGSALVKAVAEGADGLRVLSEQYPRDPAVLKALVLAFAAKSDTLLEAMETTRRLLLIAPEKQEDADLRYVVSRAANDRGKASELAFVVMGQHMGKYGADALYDLMLRRPELETRIKIALESLRGSSQFSPALAIAYDLHFAPNCASRLGLLPRAREFGDERSAQVLFSLIRRPPGCRPTRRHPCRARCSAEYYAFADALRQIRSRPASSNGQPQSAAPKK
jgi:hypothetical protein